MRQIVCITTNAIIFYDLTVDNGSREGLDKFLKAASSEPETVLHYEFMQDYKVCVEILFLYMLYNRK